jgi:AMMECR1 domain-containing protein
MALKSGRKRKAKAIEKNGYRSWHTLAVYVLIAGALVLAVQYYVSGPGTTHASAPEPKTPEGANTPCMPRAYNISLPNLSRQDMDDLIGIAYQAAEDHFKGFEKDSFPEEYNDFENEVYVVFRLDGRRAGGASYQSDNLAKSVYNAASEAVGGLCEGTRICYVNITKQDLGRLQAEVYVLDGGIQPRDLDVLFADELRLYNREFELGVHTIRLCKGTTQATYLSDVAIEGDLSPTQMTEQLCVKLGLSNKCVYQSNVDVRLYSSLHFMKIRPDKPTTVVFRGNVVSQTLPSLGDIRESLTGMTKWLLNDQNSDGTFKYSYSLSSGSYSSANNMIRQLLASRVLAEKATQNHSLIDAHRRNMDYVFKNWYITRGERGYIYFEGVSKLGADAAALRVLSYSPIYGEYEREAKALANTIYDQQEANGSFRAFAIEPKGEYAGDYLLTFYSGEAILALSEYYLKSGDKRALDAAIKAQDYYITKYVTHIDENYYPAYVPWHTMSLYNLYNITGDEKYVQAIFVLNDRIIQIQQIEKPVYPDIWGRFFDPDHIEYGFPHSSSTGVYLEGLTYAYELARQKGDTKRMETYGKSIRLATLDIINLQVRDDNVYYLNHPERVLGAIRAEVTQNYVRIDNTQHSTDAFTRIVKIFSEQEFGNA